MVTCPPLPHLPRPLEPGATQALLQPRDACPTAPPPGQGAGQLSRATARPGYSSPELLRVRGGAPAPKAVSSSCGAPLGSYRSGEVFEAASYRTPFSTDNRLVAQGHASRIY